MRWMLLAAAVLVTVIGAPLFLCPDKTAFLFSWTVNPPVTAAFLGGAYLAAADIKSLWPWALSALTAHMALEGDNQRVAHANAALIVFCVLEVLAAIRLSAGQAANGDLIIDWSAPRIWLFVVALVAMLGIAAAGWSARVRG